MAEIKTYGLYQAKLSRKAAPGGQVKQENWMKPTLKSNKSSGKTVKFKKSGGYGY
jgi:hypothetical protein